MSTDPANSANSAEEVEITIETTASPHERANETIQELEVEVRNHTGSSQAPGAQQIALDLLRLIRENAQNLSKQAAEQIQSLRSGGTSDYLDPDFWKGLGMVLEYQVNEIRALIQRRVRGEYTTDAYGMDQEIVELLRPIAGFLYRSWWRINSSGLEHIPAEGGVLLAANHAGVLPWDGAMLATALLDEHPAGRMVRVLHQRWMSVVPVLAPTIAAVGQVPALPENAERLLADGQVVAAFPEGPKAGGKLFRDRYQLAGFDAEAFVRAALRSKAAIVPVAIIGAEESYPVIANFDRVAKLLGLPYLPITPLFPLLGPLGLIPLPTKWSILIGEPLNTGSGDPEDQPLVTKLSNDLRSSVEALISRGLAERESVF
jgi:1-acyl-sn-glycerol-3-phosphate acyltransferase